LVFAENITYLKTYFITKIFDQSFLFEVFE